MKRSVYKFTVLMLIWIAGTCAQQTTADSSSRNQLYPIEKIPVADSIKIPVLDFKNSDIKDVLRGLGMQYNVNIFVDPDVTGAVSLYLVDVSVKNAIDFIAKRNSCIYTVDNGIVKISKYQAPPPPPPPKPKLEFHMENELLSIDVKDVQVQDIARMFSDSARVNVILDGATEKLISARLVKLKPEKAVKALFESNGFEVTLSDGIYYVTKSWEKGSDGKQSNAQFRPLSLSVKEKMVTLEVDNASLDQLIRNLSVQSGMNIVIYDKLAGDITARLNAVPIDDALRFLLQNTKFTFWKEKEIYFIGSREMNQQKTTQMIPLKHIRAEEATISKALPPSVTANAVVKYDSEHNAVIVIGSFDVVSAAQSFIEKIDKPVPQVLIEALVVDFNINKSRSFGLSVFTSDSSSHSNSYSPGINITSGKATSEKILNKIATADILKNVLNNIGAKQIVSLPDNFRAQISALETADIVKVHSTPQIATINGNSASITIGETRYYKLEKETVTPNDNSSTVIGKDQRFEVLKFNTVLEVTPWVMDDGYVMVKIRPEFNIPRKSSDESIPPNVDTRVIESMVRLKNGQTIVLGGQRQTDEIVNRSGVPFLSSIPILGWLFSHRTVAKTETQMMIFLTPHVYYGDENSVSPDQYFGKEINKALDKYGFKGDKKKKGNEGSVVIKKDTVSVKPDTVLQSAVVQDSTAKAQENIRKKESFDVKKPAVDSVTTDSTRIENKPKQKKKRTIVRWPWRRRSGSVSVENHISKVTVNDSLSIESAKSSTVAPKEKSGKDRK